MTAIATSVAALVAAVSVIASWALFRAEQRRTAARGRLDDALRLLAAFEHHASFMSRDAEPPEFPESARHALSSFVAAVRGSSEPLPITRGLMFHHIPFGADDEDEAAHLTAAPFVGDPETDDEDVMTIRAELIQSVMARRAEVEGRDWQPPTWRGRDMTGIVRGDTHEVTSESCATKQKPQPDQL